MSTYERRHYVANAEAIASVKAAFARTGMDKSDAELVKFTRSLCDELNKLELARWYEALGVALRMVERAKKASK